MPDGVNFCTKCGTPLGAAQTVPSENGGNTSFDFWNSSSAADKMPAPAAANADSGEVIPSGKPAGNIIMVGDMIVDSVYDPTLPEGMFRGSNGAIYWHYTQNTWKHPTDLLMMLQIFMIIYVFFLVMGVIMSIANESIRDLLNVAKGVGIGLLILDAFTAIIWSFINMAHHGRKEMDFELTDNKITYHRSKHDEERSRKIADATEIINSFVGDFNTYMAAEQTRAAAGGWSTTLDGSLTSLRVHRRHHSIWLAMGPVNSFYFAAPHQLDFLVDHISSRLPNIKIKDKNRR